MAKVIPRTGLRRNVRIGASKSACKIPVISRNFNTRLR